jgi:hypothetical protein
MMSYRKRFFWISAVYWQQNFLPESFFTYIYVKDKQNPPVFIILMMNKYYADGWKN